MFAFAQQQNIGHIMSDPWPKFDPKSLQGSSWQTRAGISYETDSARVVIFSSEGQFAAQALLATCHGPSMVPTEERLKKKGKIS